MRKVTPPGRSDLGKVVHQLATRWWSRGPGRRQSQRPPYSQRSRRSVVVGFLKNPSSRCRGDHLGATRNQHLACRSGATTRQYVSPFPPTTGTQSLRQPPGAGGSVYILGSCGRRACVINHHSEPRGTTKPATHEGDGGLHLSFLWALDLVASNECLPSVDREEQHGTGLVF